MITSLLVFDIVTVACFCLRFALFLIEAVCLLFELFRVLQLVMSVW